MSTMTDSPVPPANSLPLPRRPTPSQIAPRTPLSPDGGVFDIMSLPKVYARAAGIGLRSPPLSADKETFTALSGRPAAGVAAASRGGSQASGSSVPSASTGAKASFGPATTGVVAGGVAGAGVVDRKGKGRAVEEYDPFIRPGLDGQSAPTSPDTHYAFEHDMHSRSPVLRNYAPPKKPLTPRQLSRIAQSFGIAIPLDHHSAQPSLSSDRDLQLSTRSRASPIASSSRITLDPHPRSRPRPSAHLVTVLPPASLLPLGTSTTESERKRWARGRLIPLQPTYGGMLGAIAREFGLPGVVGLSVYLKERKGTGRQRGPGSEQEEEAEGEGSIRQVKGLGALIGTNAGGGDEGGRATDSADGGEGGSDGPMITPQTWSALFGSFATQPTLSARSSRGSTPTGTPRRFHLTHDLGSDTSLPKHMEGSNNRTGSPFGKGGDSGSARPFQMNRQGDLFPTRARLNSLPTQNASATRAVPTSDPNSTSGVSAVSADHSISTISDTSTSTLSETSLPTPPYATSATSSYFSAAAPASVIVATLELEVDDNAPWMGEWYRRLDQARRNGRTMPSMVDETGIGLDGAGAYTEVGKGVRKLRLPGKVADAAHSPRFMREYEREPRREGLQSHPVGGDIPTIHIHAREPSSDHNMLPGTSGTAGGGGLMPNADLLASPIHLGLSPDMAAGAGAGGMGGLTKSMLLTDEEREILQRELAKRGSALVMSDQLDDLEKMMRQLSPRNISMTSPRQMTPNTAARIATSTLTMPVPPLSSTSSTSAPAHEDAPSREVRKKTLSSSSTATSSTASTHRDRNGSMDPKVPHAAWAITANKSAASINTFATTTSALSSVPSFDATTLSRPPMEAAFEEYQEEEMTSPRLRKTSDGSSLGTGRGITHRDVGGGEYFRPAVIARGIDEEQGEGRFRKNRDRSLNGGKVDGEDQRNKGNMNGNDGPLSPGLLGGRGFLGRSRSKSKSKPKTKDGVPFPPMSPDVLGSGRPDGDVPTSAGLTAQPPQGGSWKPSRPQRPPSPDFNDPSWSAGLSSPEFAFSPEMVEKLQAGSNAGSPHTPNLGGARSAVAAQAQGQGMKQFSPFSLSDPSKSGQTGQNNTPRTPQTPMSPYTDESADHHASQADDNGNSKEEGGERKKPRSGSMSLKGLRNMSSRSFGRKEKERPPALPLGAAGGSNGRTQSSTSTTHSPAPARNGDAFSGQVSPDRPTFHGSRSANVGHTDAEAGHADTIKSSDTRRSGASALSGAGEFGRMSGDAAASISQAPSSGKEKDKENGFSRLFGFANRKSTDTARSTTERERDFGASITWNQSGQSGGTGISNGNGNGEKRLPGAKMLAGLGLGHVRGRSGDHAPRLGTGNPHPGAARSISGPVSVTMTSSASAGDLGPEAGRPSGDGRMPLPSSGLSSGLRGSPSYNSFAQAQAQARGSSDVARGAGSTAGHGHVASGWDGLAELHRATTGASAATVTQANATGAGVGAGVGVGVPGSPASPRSVRRKPVPGHAA